MKKIEGLLWNPSIAFASMTFILGGLFGYILSFFDATWNTLNVSVQAAIGGVLLGFALNVAKDAYLVRREFVRATKLFQAIFEATRVMAFGPQEQLFVEFRVRETAAKSAISMYEKAEDILYKNLDGDDIAIIEELIRTAYHFRGSFDVIHKDLNDGYLSETDKRYFDLLGNVKRRWLEIAEYPIKRRKRNEHNIEIQAQLDMIIRKEFSIERAINHDVD